MARSVEEVTARWDDTERRLRNTPEAEAARRLRRQRAVGRAGKKLGRVGMAAALVTFGLMFYGLFIAPLGIDGLFTGIGLAIVAMVLVLVMSRERPIAASTIAAAPPAMLPSRTDAWLDRQRKRLPPAAAPVLDAISTRLAQLEPQLALMDQRNPVSDELNRLLGQHLPGLVDSYAKLPEPERRRAPAGGGLPMEARLIEGLKLVEAELGDATEQLAAADRDAFLTQGRFLETRYGKTDAEN